MNTTATDRPDRRTRRDRPTAFGADRPTPTDETMVNRATVAAMLGVSVESVKRLQRRAGVPGRVVPSAAGGRQCLLTADEVEILRQSVATDSARPALAEPDRSRPTGAADPDAGWRELVAELRHEADRLRSDLAVATAARDVAVGRAESAEAALYTTAARLEALRASVAIWYALLRRPLWRLRPLPALPVEVASSAPALAPPEG